MCFDKKQIVHNFQSSETIRFVMNIAKKLVWKSSFGLSNAVFKHQKLIQAATPNVMPRVKTSSIA